MPPIVSSAVSGLYVMILLHVWETAARLSLIDHTSFQDSIAFMSRPTFSLSETWQALGPFQIGTREAAWGADPLEYYGGFSTLQSQDGAKFRSSLASNGTVTWSSAHATLIQSTDTTSKLSLRIGFSNVDWTFLQTVYGWSALQWQGWVRGEIIVTSEEPVNTIMYTDNVLEYVLDGTRHFGGDYYAFRNAPLVVRLSPGKHVLELRIIRDVRSMGGIGHPTVDVNVELKQSVAFVELGLDKLLVSDLVDGSLPSPYASMIVRNSGDDWIEVYQIAQISSEGGESLLHLDFQLLESNSIMIGPGQSRPLAFVIRLLDHNDSSAQRHVDFEIKYRVRMSSHTVGAIQGTILFKAKSTFEPHKVTHMHPGGIVSYAILRPPARNAMCANSFSSKKAPVMLLLHGAGVEAEDDLVAHALDSLPNLCAWVLFPTGVTPWSADDWHNWGFADVQTAISNIPSWIKTTGWQGIDVDTNRWFVSGHSNGGQGTWYTLLHHPDKVFAASPISGYLSIHEYVPYKFWRPAEPRKRAIIEAAANSYRHELLASNARGIPILQQHGSADDNVPAYHSRLMSQILAETSSESNYSEVAGQGHWWNGVVATDVLAEFYKQQLNHPREKQVLPKSFELVVANPGDTGSKFGLRILYLLDPSQLGRISATRNDNHGAWSLRTYNVMAFEWTREYLQELMTIDDRGDIVWEAQVVATMNKPIRLWRSDSASWTNQELSMPLRKCHHLGGMDAILRTQGAFNIVYQDTEAFPIALQVSRNLLQYFHADSELVSATASTSRLRAAGNRILLALDSPNSFGLCTDSFPLSICQKSRAEIPVVTLTRPGSKTPSKLQASSSELGAIFVRPSHDSADEVLELVLWGSTPAMLAQAARLVPLMTGTGQPDFIVLDKTARWRGIDGAALGFFDAKWQVSDSVGFA